MPKALSYLIVLLCAATAICSSYVITVYALGLCSAKDLVENCSYTEDYNGCKCPGRGDCFSNSGFVLMAEFGFSISQVSSSEFWGSHAVTPSTAQALFHPSYTKKLIHCLYVQPSYDSLTGASIYNCWECRNSAYGCFNHQGPIEYYLANSDYICGAF